jgi:tRNA(Ile)-lysidine synthase
MLPSGPLPGSPGQVLLRPLLPLRRADTLAVCAALDLQPRSDASNRDLAFLRNRVRAELLPLLHSFNPSIDDALLGLAASAREAFDLIERRSFEARPVERAPVGAIFPSAALAGLPGEALWLVIEREAAFLQRDPAINRTRLDNLRTVLARGSGRVAFGEVVVDVSAGKVRIGPPLEPTEPLAPAILEVPGSRRVGSWRVEVATAPLDPSAGAPVAALASANLRGALRARSLQPGDRLRWHGLLRKVSDLFVNEKIPAWERPGSVVIADGDGPAAIVTASRVFLRDTTGAPDLWVRLVPLPR